MDDANLEEDLMRMRATFRDTVAAAIVVSAGAPLSDPARAELARLGERVGLPPELQDDFQLRIAAAGQPGGGLLVDQLPTEPAMLGTEARHLSARLMLLGVRCGSASESMAMALASKLGTSDSRLARLLAAVRAGAGAHPLSGDALAAALDEFVRLPAFLRELVGVQAPPRRRVGRVLPSRYRHPLDVQATRAIAGTVAYEDVARKLSEAVPERAFALLNAAGRVRVGPDQFPELYDTYQRCVRRLGIHPEPPLYLNRGGFNAMTSGIERPFVIVNDLLVGILPQRELEFIIGHELGHIKFDHVLYLTIAQLLKVPGQVLNAVPIVGPLVRQGLDLLLFEWMRKAELSCDRAGLLCCQDPDAAFRVMMRSAGAPALYQAEFNVDAFIAQYDDLEEQQKTDLISRAFYLLSTMTRSHPWAAVRAYELKKWIDDGDYHGILEPCPMEDGSAADPETTALSHRCGRCAATVPPGVAACLVCGTPVEAADALHPCGHCGHLVEPGHRFCEQCGTPVVRPPVSEPQDEALVDGLDDASPALEE